MNYIKLKLFRFVSIFMYFLFSFIATSKEKKIIKECKNYSFATTSDYHLWQLLFLFKKINKKNFSGNFVECGTWKGIYLVFFQKLIELYKLKDSKIYGFDTFEGFPEPSKSKDFSADGKSMLKRYRISKLSKNKNSWNYAGINEVKKNFFNNTLKNKNLNLFKGKVEDTLIKKKNIPYNIAILKLDTCLYSGTKIELEVLYPQVISGGIIIIDNYFNYSGVKKATKDFFKKKKNIIKYSYILDRVVIYK